MKKFIIGFLFLSFNLQTFSQTKKLSTDTIVLNNMIDSSLYRSDINSFITPKVLDKLISKYHYQIGGSGIKDGSIYGYNSTITDKAFTINGAISTGEKLFFIQPTLSIKNNEGILRVLDTGKIANIFTGGLAVLFNIKKSSAFYSAENKVNLHNKLRINREIYYSSKDSNTNKCNLTIQNAQDFINSLSADDKNMIQKFYDKERHINFAGNQSLINKINSFNNFLEALNNSNLIENFKKLNFNDILNIISKLGKEKCLENNANNYSNLQDETQINSVPTKSIHWMRMGINYNMQDIKIFDTLISNKITPYLHEFFSASLSYNIQWINNKRFNKFLSFDLSYSNARNTDKDNLKKVQTTSPLSIPGLTGQSVSNTEFFYLLPNRLNTLNFLITGSLYNPDRKFGYEATIRLGHNNINANNISATFGIFLPVGVKDDGSAIIIQPNINFVNLMRNKTDVFWEDNFNIGFLLSANIPRLSKKRG